MKHRRRYEVKATTGAVSYLPVELAQGGNTQIQTMTITDVAVGEQVVVSPPSTGAGTAILLCHAYVSAKDTVSLAMVNLGVTVTPTTPTASAPWIVTVIS